LKEKSVYSQFIKRFEEGLSPIRKGMETEDGVKQYDKVNRRPGRLKQKYPSVYRMYDIKIIKNKKDVCTSVTCLPPPSLRSRVKQSSVPAWIASLRSQ
jgi:hypothetical protein